MSEQFNADCNIWHDPLLKEIYEDEEKFNAVGYYRRGMDKTFVCTQQQFNEWDIGAWRAVEFDKLNIFDPNDEIPADLLAPKNEVEMVQEKFDDRLSKEKEIRRLKEYIQEMSDRTIDGDRQPRNKRKSRERRKWQIENLKKAS